MKGSLAKYSSSAAAVVLSVLVLSTFALARDRGPESTVRRYHIAVAQNNRSVIELELADADKESGQYLTSVVRQAISVGATIQLGRVTMDGKTSYVDVVYSLGGNQVLGAFRFVVLSENGRWRIDAAQTIALQRQMFEFS